MRNLNNARSEAKLSALRTISSILWREHMGIFFVNKPRISVTNLFNMQSKLSALQNTIHYSANLKQEFEQT